MPSLVLIRHGQSAWNLENRFTGWWDVDVTEKGVGAHILQQIMATARARGYRRLSLETGSAPSFDAAHALYRKFGFTECGAFGDYPGDDPFSRFMTRVL